MNRTPGFIIAAVFVLLAIPVVATFGEYTRSKIIHPDSSSFVQTIAELVHTGDSIEMTEAVDFEWDTLYIFGPYTDWREMEQQVGTRWYRSYTDYLLRRSPLGHYPLDDDSLQKLVFVRSGKVVLDATISRGVVDFTAMNRTMFSREEASFDLKRERGRAVALLSRTRDAVA